MKITDQIDKVFGNINYNNKRQFHSPEIKYSISKNDRKSPNKKKSVYNIVNNDLNKSIYLINNINEDNVFYDEFMKKIKEEEKEIESPSRVNRKKHNVQIKPGIFKKEKSQANFHVKHFLENKKENLKKNNSLKFDENVNDEIYLTPKGKTKVNKKINFNDTTNNIKIKQRNSKTLFNNNNFLQSQNLMNLIYEKNNMNNMNTNIYNHQKSLKFEEKIEAPVQIEIINDYRKFKNLQVQSSISFGQITKEANFSNVQKLNLNLKKNNPDSDNKSTINVNQEIIYPTSNNLIKKKRNSIFCCL